MILQDGTRSDNALIDWLGRDMTTFYQRTRRSQQSPSNMLNVSMVSVSTLVMDLSGALVILENGGRM